MEHLPKSYLAVILLIIASFSVQAGAAIAKQLFLVIGPEGVTAWRLAFSAILLLVIFQPWRKHFPKKNRMNLIYYGIAIGSMNFIFYQSLKRLDIGIAVGIEFLGPLTVAILASRRPIDFFWILLVIAGLLLLLPWGGGKPLDPIGVLYALGAGVFWAFYIIFGRKAGLEFGVSAVGIGLAVGALIYFPIGGIVSGTSLFSPQILPYAFGVALLSSAIPYALDIYVLSNLSNKTYGTLTSLEPAIAAFSGFIFLGEILTLLQWGALMAIIIASVGATIFN